ncbi:MAG: thioredoxin domain-containing protein [Candidatus Andersenbacteria bacterium]
MTTVSEPASPPQAQPPVPLPPTPPPPKHRSLRAFDLLVLAIVAVAAGGAWLSLARSTQTYELLKNQSASLGGALANSTAPATPVTVAIQNDDPVDGPSDAPVTVVEFSDFQCPFCGQFEPGLSQARKDYAGKVRFVYKDFPLTQLHPNARPAAIAAQCVADLAGSAAFFTFHDQLFAHQSTLSPALYEQLAGKIDGLNLGDFKTCVAKERTAPEVDQDTQDGTAVGVGGTPTTFVNGVAVEGADVAGLRAAIDAALKK